MHVKDEAICLRAVNYSDTSQVVTLLCREHGKVAAMAKGSRRAKSAFDGPIEVFSCGPAVFVQKDTGGQLANLTEFTQQPRFRKLASRLVSLNAGLFAAELTEAFLEDRDPHPMLFDKLLKFLETVQDSEDEPSVWAWLILFQIRLLEETGIAPVWDRCVNCSASLAMNNTASSDKTRVGKAHPTMYFSSRNNGLLCPGCETTFPEKRSVDRKIVQALQRPALLAKTDFETLNAAEHLMIYHLTELHHRPPKMAKYFVQ
jgi:DNA repair protein RecO (recombination protein O)